MIRLLLSLVLLLSLGPACGPAQPYKDNSSLVVTYYGKEVHRRNTGYISHAQLRKILEKKERFVVIFSAKWCKACDTVRKSIDKAKLKTNVYYLNMDELWVQKLAALLQIRGIPLMLDIDESGNTAESRIGPLSILSYLLLKY